MSINRIDSAALYAACGQEGSAAQIVAFEQLWAALYPLAYTMLRDRPGGEGLAADCTQAALIKIYRNLERCHTPAAFREWCGRVLRRTVIDELRRPEHARRAPLPEDDEPGAVSAPPPAPGGELRATLEEAIAHGPLSERSQRVVAGRYFAEQSDEALARAETDRAGQAVLPSHIQVTRAKNLAKLRADTGLVARLRELMEE